LRAAVNPRREVKRFWVLHNCVEPQFERLKGQSKLFASADSLDVSKHYKSLDEVKDRSNVEARPIRDLPQG
jgi:hypothetical protein